MCIRLVQCLIFGVLINHSKCQNEFFIAKKYYKHDSYCVTNSSFALSWVQDKVEERLQQESNFIPQFEENQFDCSIREITTHYEPCIQGYTTAPWTFQKSLSSEVVLDRRWEEMEVIKTEYVSYRKTPLKFENVLSDLKEDFFIPFSLRTDEAHIFLCDGSEPHKSNCYWFMLEAWGRAKSAIRKCSSNSISDLDQVYPEEPCKTPIVEKNHPTDIPHYLFKNRWSHFILTKRSNKLTLRSGIQSRNILELEDKSEVIAVTHMILHSKTNHALWKIHQLEYSYTNATIQSYLGSSIKAIENSVCISMFVSMCDLCSLKLELIRKSDTFIAKEETYKSKGVQWFEIKFIMENLQESDRFWLRVSTEGTSDDRFWAIDNVKQCQKKGYRAITLSTEAQCQLLSDDNNIIHFEPGAANSEINCPENTIGRMCIPCGWLGFSNCKQITVCFKHKSSDMKCYCSAGFRTDRSYYDTTNSCYYECPSGYYGFGCKKCGHCKYNYDCNAITGQCSYGCEDNYVPPKCTILKGITFTKAPNIENVTYTEATIRVTDFEVTNSENEVPSSYICQYKEDASSNWKSVGELRKFEDGSSISIYNLTPDTNYQVRCVILDRGNRQYEHIYIPYAKFKTKCQELSENDFVIKPSNTSVDIEIDQTNKHKCKMETHHISIVGNDGERIRIGKGLEFNNLKPFTDYTLVININSKTYKKEFKTTEGVPSKVQHFKAVNASTTSIHLTWQEPVWINGELQYYYVEYQHLNYLSCNWGSSLKNNTTVKETFVTLYNLIPYSQYSIRVFAVNAKFDGKPTKITYKTLASNIIENEEIPEIKQIVTDFHTANIVLSSIDCSKHRGPLSFVEVELYCVSEWCERKYRKIYKNFFQNHQLILDELQPFVKYKLQLMFCRNNTVCSQVVNAKDLETEVTVPNAVRNLTVYSKNRNSLSLRWKPPYPPTGHLSIYRIDYCQNNNLCYKNVWSHKDLYKDLSQTTCKLWPDWQCIEIQNLTDYVYYTVNILARNEKPEEYGKQATITAKTIIEQSEAPYDLNTIWTMENDLELEWKHPNVSNGDISRFEIIVVPSSSQQSSLKSFRLSVETYNLTYHFKIDAPELPSSPEYKIRVWAFNGLKGKELIKKIISPPDIPLLKQEPEISSTNDSITLNISVPHLKGNSEKINLIILSPEKGSNTMMYTATTNFDLIKNKILFNCTLQNSKQSHLFTIGNEIENDKCTSNADNPPLISGNNYTIHIILTNHFENEYRRKVYAYKYSTQGPTPLDEGSNAGLLALLLLLLIPLAVLLYMKRNQLSSIKKRLLENIYASREMLNPQQDSRIPLSSLPKKETNTTPSTPVSTKQPIPQDRPTTSKVYSKRVKITEYEQYVKESIQNGEFERQHSLFPRGQTKPWTYGSLKENKSKNRYNNLIAYDHSRVILEKIGNDPHSDYINANYIDGYRVTKAYIATQGPKASTLYDFWRMIWQENVKHIAMLANIIEGGKKKVEQYWPAINETLKFKDISVKHVSNKVYADYEHRIFSVSRRDQTRQVEQLHFSSWPDHGVPLYSQSLVPFLQKMLKIALSPKSPVVVHCSAGVGRTGTVLLCDVSLRMAAREGSIDVLHNLQKLRDQRANLVDNVEQYKLAHLVILECLAAMHTGIPCNEIETAVEKLFRDGKIAAQMQYLKDTQWQDQAMKTVGQMYEEAMVVSSKNRFQHIIPEIPGRVFLRRSSSDDTSSYINAVHVDGFRCPGRFIVTQQPLPNTVGDFWRLVDEYDVSTVISLNEVNPKDKTCCAFWPTTENPQMKPERNIDLVHGNTTSMSFYDVVKVHLENDVKREHRVVDIVSLKNWPAKTKCPKKVEEFITFWEEADAVSRKSECVVVTCYDGVTASGLFVAMSFVIEKMKLEQICDVCQAVRNVRHNREQFVQHEEQFEFLYKVAVNYINSFQPYANFN